MRGSHQPSRRDCDDRRQVNPGEAEIATTTDDNCDDSPCVRAPAPFDRQGGGELLSETATVGSLIAAGDLDVTESTS
jgi:hypothetical protein